MTDQPRDADAAAVEEASDKLRVGHSCIEIYQTIIPHLRQVAKGCGYAIAVHGSLIRDIDLIAVAWIADATPGVELARRFTETLKRVNKGIAFQKPGEDQEWHQAGMPGNKPWRRLGFIWHLGGGPYIDLCVIEPRKELPYAAMDEWLKRKKE